MPFKIGDHVPKDAVHAGYMAEIGNLYVGRGPFGARHGCVGSMGTSTGGIDGALSHLKCHHSAIGGKGGFTLDCGEILVAPHHKVTWEPIKHGDPLPAHSFRAGIQPQDGCLYVGRVGEDASDAEVGKLTTIDKAGIKMADLWCPSSGSLPKGQMASILCIEPCKPKRCGARYRHVKTVLSHCTETVTLTQGHDNRTDNAQRFLHELGTGTMNYSQFNANALGGEQGGISGQLSSGTSGGLGLGVQAGGGAGANGALQAGVQGEAGAGVEAGASANVLADAAAHAGAKMGGGLLGFLGGPKVSANANASAHASAAAGAGASAMAQLGAELKAGVGAFASAFLSTAAQAAMTAFAQGNIAGQFSQFFSAAVGKMEGTEDNTKERHVEQTVNHQVHKSWSTTSNTVVLSNGYPLSMQVWQLDLYVQFEGGSEMVMPTTYYTTSFGRSAPCVSNSMLTQFGIPLKSTWAKFAAYLQSLCAC